MDVPQAAAILSTYQEARALLIGKSVALSNGKAGTVENVWLDELHGGKWPVSTIRFPEV
jgi:hypothetical protein